MAERSPTPPAGDGPDPRDPLTALSAADAPATPRAAFADGLRRRIEHELADLTEPADDGAEATITATPARAPIGVIGPELVNPGSLFYATMPGPDIERSARFYRELLGWQLDRGPAGYQVTNTYPPMGLAAVDSTAPEVWIEVLDIHDAVASVRRLGGTAAEPAEYPSGWSAACVDPQGVRFNLSVPRTDYRQVARSSTEPGELFYWTLPAPDAEVSRAFYGELLGWEFGAPGDQGGMHVSNRQPDGGLGGGREGSAPELFFRVADLDEAMARVRRLGGRAEGVGEGPEGRHARCVDDQGVTFGLSEPAPGY